MRRFGLIGRKLGHSLSADFFNGLFAREGICARYDLFELREFADIYALIESMPELEGLNVTIPYKRDAARACSTLTAEAEGIGAVNVLSIRRCGGCVTLHGANTDAPGFAAAVAPLAEGKERALVLGTGGASRAVCYALKSMGLNPQLVSRSHPEPNPYGVITYQMVTEEVMAENLLIVNTTPLGMSPDVESAPPIPYEMLTPEHACFDLVYNPRVTEFMRRAAERGCRVSDGLQLLHNQALLARDIWKI